MPLRVGNKPKVPRVRRESISTKFGGLSLATRGSTMSGDTLIMSCVERMLRVTLELAGRCHGIIPNHGDE
eukprot:scaffold14035_cov172-Amphora_coffeaeformis.AAC.1